MALYSINVRKGMKYANYGLTKSFQNYDSVLPVITEVIELPFLKNVLHACDRLGTANTGMSSILTLMN